VPVSLAGDINVTFLHLAEIWAVRTGAVLRVVSANDHRHSRRSQHYEDAALDFQGTQLAGLAAWFSDLGYRVLWRVPNHYYHVHVESWGTSVVPDPNEV
jgi:hypothetical protein